MAGIPDPQAFRAWLEKQVQAIAGASYYELLGVAPDTNVGLIRRRYYELVARYHPDLYGASLDPETRQRLVTVYSSIVEAYQVLTSDVKRQQYDAGLAAGKLRWSAEEQRAPVKKVEIQGDNARRLFKLGQDALRAGNAKGAVMNLKMALSVEPGNPVIQAELARAEALLKGA